MKHKSIIIAFLLLSNSIYAQRYVSFPGINDFSGIWTYTNGVDTITFKCIVRYVGNDKVQAKGSFVYYSLKQGTNVIWNNLSNSIDPNKADLAGSKVIGNSNDTLVLGGIDKLKRKTEEGYLILTANKTELKYVRNIGIGGGGLRHHGPGQAPLPGYTLPAEFTLTKYVPPVVEMRKPQQ